MEFSVAVMLLCVTVLFDFAPPGCAQPVSSPAATPSPAPAPAPTAYVNLEYLLSVAGPFQTFLDYLQSADVLETFQNQANNTDEGITIFVPKDGAFKSLKKPSLSNLTQDQIKQVLLFHALPHYYSLSDFNNLSQLGPVSTFAGAGEFALNFTDVSGTVHLDSGWSKTKISSSVHSTDPVAIYEVDKVLLPEAIFGTDIPPMPAPAPAPDISPVADSSSTDASESKHSKGDDAPNSSHKLTKWGIWIQSILASYTILVFFFF